MSFYKSATDGNTSGFPLCFRLLLWFQAYYRRITAINLVGVVLQYHPRHSLIKLKAPLLGFSLSFSFFLWKGVSCVFSHFIERNITCGRRKQNLQAWPRHTYSLSLPGSVMKRLEIHTHTHTHTTNKNRESRADNRDILAWWKSKCQIWHHVSWSWDPLP